METLKISRPGMWPIHMMGYIFPVSFAGRMGEAILTPVFWIGLVYMTFPLGMLMYGWNDIVDFDLDKSNPRKGQGYLHGARTDRNYLDRLWIVIAGSQIPFFAACAYLSGIRAFFVMITFIIANMTYNLPNIGLRTVPILEFINPWAVCLIFPWSSIINNVPALPTASVVHVIICMTQLHCMDEIMDFHYDRKGKRRNVATVFGVVYVKALLIFLTGVDVAFSWKIAGSTAPRTIVIAQFLAGIYVVYIIEPLLGKVNAHIANLVLLYWIFLACKLFVLILTGDYVNTFKAYGL